MVSLVMEQVGLDLERIIFIGRTYEEYLAMFGLTEAELQDKTILDCPAGAWSFTALGNQKKLDVTACDIAYYHETSSLENKGKQDLEHAMINLTKARENYLWSYFVDIDDLRTHRLQALTDCVKDMNERPTRYVPVTLPTLPFADDTFDLLLSAHFLFMYADRLDQQFHFATLKELLRVTKEELRIFPLVDLQGQRYEYLDEMIEFLVKNKYQVTEIKVAYQFQKNADSLLKITK